MKKSEKIPKYSLMYTVRILRTVDAVEVTNLLRGFRANSLAALMAEFKKKVAIEKTPSAPKQGGPDDVR